MASNAELIPSIIVLIVETDGTTRRETWARDTTADKLHTTIGGYFDCRGLVEGRLDMWLSDDGIYTREPNPFATAICMAVEGATQPFFGTAVFTGGVVDDDPDGNTTTLGDDLADEIESAVARLTQHPGHVEVLRSYGLLFASRH